MVADSCTRGQELDETFAKWCYTVNVPASLASQPETKAMLQAVQQHGFMQGKVAGPRDAPPLWEPPSQDTIRSRLLDKVYADSLKQAQDVLQIESSETPISLCLDGCKDVSGNPIINICAQNEHGAVFMTAFNAKGKKKDGTYTASYIDAAIKAIGAFPRP